ncbi:sulfite exporter TauE/SafE family protein [Candidatus Gottesmanbacteria bacterium]|nr:sulfite exporter TauE/SafE family protein [Candidatus Gottesmanbacteria bacterium]
MNKTKVDIKGMHCNSCEILIEDELLKIPGVKKVKVSQKKACAEIFYKGQLNQKNISLAIQKAGAEYSLGKEQRQFFSHNAHDYMDLSITIMGVFALLFLAKALGVFEIGAKTGNNFNNLPVVFLIGLTAGVSTCMAIVGGLVLGASARFAEKHPTATTLQKFKPHLFFNLGRIISYFILGGLIGYLGSFLQLSTSVLGLLTIAVGFVMLLLGIQLTEIVPGLSRIKFTLPKQISRLFGIKQKSEQEYSHKNSAMMGALTFFLPCGFTQAMQLYAISKGNPVTGAITMGVFALGTTPGLLGIGGLTAVVKGAFAKHFFRFAGVVVALLAFFNISNGLNLTGNPISSVLSYTSAAAAQGNNQIVPVKDGVQIMEMTQDATGYNPNKFTVQKGIPVRWIINSTNSATCASSVIASQIDVRKQLSSGENIIKFTPTETGTIKFSCSMGMYTGTITVVEAKEKPTKPSALKIEQTTPTSIESEPTPTVTQKIITPEVTQEPDIQILKATYSLDNDVQPRTFVAKADHEVRLEIEALDNGRGCMGSVMIPGLTEPQGFNKGETTILTFKPKKGTYQLTCAMGVPHGIIIAN